MKKMSCILIFMSMFFVVQKLSAAEFEGTITIIKQTLYDTTLFTFQVKKKLVRIDEKNMRNEVIQSLIIDITTKSITALSPSQKLYTKIYKNRVTPPSDIKVTKTTNFKMIEGYKCYQWRVRNNTVNSEISLWVCAESFTFFSEVMDLLSKTEDYSEYCRYFNLIPDNSGYFPIMVVERTLLREEKTRVMVQSIQRKEINESIFQIPKDYKCLQN